MGGHGDASMVRLRRLVCASAGGHMETDAGRLEPRPAAVRPLFAQPHTADCCCPGLPVWLLGMRRPLFQIRPLFTEPRRQVVTFHLHSRPFYPQSGTEARRVLHRTPTTSAKHDICLLFVCLSFLDASRPVCQKSEVAFNLLWSLQISPRGNVWPKLSLCHVRFSGSCVAEAIAV